MANGLKKILLTSMEYLIVGIVALLASLLTFFSGFGLGTLLMPVFALFFPVETAIAATGIVHLSNNLFKIGLVGKSVSKQVVIQFGVPAILGALLGAYLLNRVAELAVVFPISLAGYHFNISPVNSLIGAVLIVFALRDIFLPKEKGFNPKWLPFGGLISGFFGGLSGHQGALRTAFLVQLKLSKNTFIASGIAIAVAVDLARIPVYFKSVIELNQLPIALFLVATLSAFVGAILGKRYLKKIKLASLHVIVAVAMIIVALAMILGLL